jgi:hypothetical protein
MTGASEDIRHPKIRRIHDYWQSLRPAEDMLPGRQHFDPLAVAPLLPNLRLIDVQRRPLRFRYRLVGTRIVDAHARDLTGLWLDEVHPEFTPGSDLYREYIGVIESGRPSHRRGEPIFIVNADKFAELERILLPLAQDGRTVDMLLAATVFLNRQGDEI